MMRVKTAVVNISKLMTIMFLALGIFGCSSTIGKYGVSVSNVETMKQLQFKPVAVEKFESYKPGLHSLGGCRGASSIETPAGISFESYIEQAFIDELKLAGLYDPKSTTSIRCRLDKIGFNSKVLAGKWLMTLTISSKANPGFTIDSKYELSTNWAGAKACQQVAQAYSAAVQQLIKEIVSDPRFKQL